jgi:hypothetical protein
MLPFASGALLTPEVLRSLLATWFDSGAYHVKRDTGVVSMGLAQVVVYLWSSCARTEFGAGSSYSAFYTMIQEVITRRILKGCKCRICRRLFGKRKAERCQDLVLC